ncbi:MAG TPA: Dps family protein [Flavobacteriales bacterium]|nr:Dps family protein [Flavobacteriales bacterium]
MAAKTTKAATKKQVSKKPAAPMRWSASDRKRLADALNTLLAAYQVHYQKLHNYHWNVEGAEFFELHELTEEQYGQAHADIDEIAERIRVFRERPLSTFAEYLKASPIKEDPGTPPPSKMVANLLADYKALLELMYSTADLADDVDDLVTEDMMIKFIARFEKQRWMLEALSGK